ncbi:MAG: bifunctional phosphopantothenoylcysteine decarboxylase/phosphopantothenate--cysteine ligase CoaBC [Actinobacteria bacterium]|nr:bifunctional phosphopantothenoylcysteine decarboxylase/phosphopantothenate--cysteine ligase CoaBC [Actinomycetota bacterium]
MARVLLGVTGGIAAYKACELARRLVLAGHDVFPLLTRGAERFVTKETFAALTRRSVGDDPYPHLTKADLLVIAPLTANTLAKLAHGLADDVLTEAALAHRGLILVAPAMNAGMWEHPATQANAETLRSRGVELIGPAAGELAEGETGVGRMAEPEEIFARCQELLGGRNGPLEGRRVLVTAGGTREPLDSARFVGNRSSGRMGVALAEEARRRGAEVTLVASNLAVAAPRGVEIVEAHTAADVEREVGARASRADVVLMAAAVADYRPAEELGSKRPKDERPWPLDLVPTVDVIASLSRRRSNGQILVAFGAGEGEAGLERKRRMLTDKDVDLVVYNDVSRDDIGFDAPDNEVVIVGRAGERRVGKAPKARVAAEILDEVETLVGG